MSDLKQRDGPVGARLHRAERALCRGGEVGRDTCLR